MGTVYELMFIAASLLLYDMTISSNKIQPIILSSNAASIQPCSAGIFFLVLPFWILLGNSEQCERAQKFWFFLHFCV